MHKYLYRICTYKKKRGIHCNLSLSRTFNLSSEVPFSFKEFGISFHNLPANACMHAYILHEHTIVQYACMYIYCMNIQLYSMHTVCIYASDYRQNTDLPNIDNSTPKKRITQPFPAKNVVYTQPVRFSSVPIHYTNPFLK